jgi:ABC-type polysaccharide/polyol phosphate transport system ATPase subunit
MDTNTNHIITVKNLNKQFKFKHKGKTSVKKYFIDNFKKKLKKYDFYALKDLSFTVNKGEFIGIIGKNGSGKSTLLKTLAGIYTHDSGEITCKEEISPIFNLGLGFKPELSGRDNIVLSAITLGLSKKEALGIVDEVIEFSELGKFIDQKTKNYSSGMRARLGFSVTTAIPQKGIFLMDEILAVGDDSFRNKSMLKIKDFLTQGKTILFVSHSINHIEEYSDRVMLLNKGEIIKFGNVKETIEMYKDLTNK